MTAKAKGNLLEDLVAMMHEVPGVLVEKRKKLPVLQGNKKRTREVDVLITSNVVGCQIQIAFGCKNEAKALDTLAVDNFAGILTDIGIPLQHGILVSIKGYTRDAQDAAKSRRIKTLLFEGLTADRLGQQINMALQSTVYLLVSQFTLNIFPYIEGASSNDPRFINAMLDSDDEPSPTQLMTCVWELWISGEIPATIGEHSVCIKPKSPEANWLVIADVTVTGLIASVPGTFSQSILKNTEAGTIDRVRISAKFDEIKGPLILEPLNSEQALPDVFKKQQVTVVTRVRVPRIVSNVGFWPPNEESTRKVKALFEAGKPVTFEDVESPNIMEAWRFDRSSK